MTNKKKKIVQGEYVSTWESGEEVHSEVTIEWEEGAWPVAGEITEWGERWFENCDEEDEEYLEDLLSEEVYITVEDSSKPFVYDALNKADAKDMDLEGFANQAGVILYS